MSKVRIGIIGSGFVSMTHAEALRYDERAELVAIAGGSRAASLARDYGVEALASIEELIHRPDIDAVIIGTPHHLHAGAAIAAARQGKHILVEKPMATSVADCRAMIEAARAADVRLMVAHFQRYRRTNAAVKRALDEGLVGRIHLINEVLIENPDESGWKVQAESRGFLLGYGVHAIDQLRWWLGSEVASVAAHCGHYRGHAVEDGSLVLLEFENGASAVLECTNALPFKSQLGSPGAAQFHAHLIGEKGVLEVDVYGQVKLKTAAGETVLDELPSWTDAKSPARIEAYAAQDSEFISSIIEHREPAITGEEGLANVRVCLAAYKAAAERRTIHLNEEEI
ncbi:MAG: Gfo/Idh/MocA family protein [Blastocatellia bacterium]